jgi:chromosome segregation ATPase
VVFLSLAALIAVSVPVWLYVGVRNELVALRTRLALTRASVRGVEDLVNDLDQDRMKRLAVLGDSIRSVSDYAQGEAQATHLRLDETDRAMTNRLDGLTRVDQAQRSRMDALERQNLTNSSAFAALSRRAQTQESATSDVSASVNTLRAALSRLDGELSRLDDELSRLASELTAQKERQAASTTAYGQLGRRVESFSTWADGFRQVGLSGESVHGRFSTLSAELRRIRLQVDSLRPMTRAVTAPDSR